MPTYSYECPTCNKEWDELISFEESFNIFCDCKEKAIRKLTTCSIKFTNPKDTSKWDNFGYRAGFNMDKAKEERRMAEAATKEPQPYRNIDDFNTKGVFDTGGITPEKTH